MNGTFKPHPRAALERALMAVGGIMALFIPFFIFAVIGSDGSEGPAILVALNTFATLIIPAIIGFAPAMQVLFTRYTIDDDGVHEEVTILNKTQRRIAWEKVTALRHRRTVIDRILGIQRVDVIAYGERGATIHLIGLRDNASTIRNHVAKQMRTNVDLGRLLSND